MKKSGRVRLPSVLAVAVLVQCLPLKASAGAGTVGNGGGAIVCDDGNGKIVSAELLDLKESEQDWEGSLRIPRTDEREQIQLKRAIGALSSLDPDTVEKMKTFLSELPQRTSFSSGPAHLPPPTDTGPPWILKNEKNCSLRGVASYDDSLERMTVDGEILNAMSPTDRAALSFHEALYWVQRHREVSTNTSISARALTAAVFSQSPIRVRNPKKYLDQTQFECNAEGNRFFLSQNNDNKITDFYFTRIGGRDLIDLTSAGYAPSLEPCRPPGSPSFWKWTWPVCDPDLLWVFNGLQPTVQSGQPTAGSPAPLPKVVTISTVSRFEPDYQIILKSGEQVTLAFVQPWKSGLHDIPLVCKKL